MRLRLGPAADLDGGDEILAPGNYRDRMANITLQTDRFILRVEMLPIVAAETTAEVKMTDVVWVRLPIGFHLGKRVSLEDPLDLADRRHDRRILFRVNGRVIGPVELVQVRGYRLNCLAGCVVRPAQNFN